MNRSRVKVFFKFVVIISLIAFASYFASVMFFLYSTEVNTILPRLEISVPHTGKSSNELHFPSSQGKSTNISHGLYSQGVSPQKPTLQASTKSGPCLYAIMLGSAGQQGAGMHSLVSFQRLTAQLENSVKLLETVMVNNEYVGYDSKNKGSVDFHDLFDIEFFNEGSRSFSNFPPFILRKEFFAAAPKQATYVIAQQTAGGAAQTIRTVWASSTGGESCYRGRVHQAVNQMGYCVIKVIEVRFLHYLRSPEELRKAIVGGGSLQHDATVIFNEWRHYWLAGDLDFTKIIRPSPKLISDMEFYERTYLNSSNDVAVMFRHEHIARFLAKQPNKGSSDAWTIEKCLQKAVETTLSLRKTGRPMVTIDLGKYGSQTLYNEDLRQYDVDKVTENAKKILQPLFGTMNFKDWEESFSHASKGVENSGYIAAMQRNLASRARCLVLVGGGTFQLMSYSDYLVNHPKKEDQCMTQICGLYKFN